MYTITATVGLVTERFTLCETGVQNERVGSERCWGVYTTEKKALAGRAALMQDAELNLLEPQEMYINDAKELDDDQVIENTLEG
jgi:hypothetical protein